MNISNLIGGILFTGTLIYLLIGIPIYILTVGDKNISNLIGGILFTGFSIYLLITVGDKREAQKRRISLERWADWEERNVWASVVRAILMTAGGIYFFIDGIIRLTREEPNGITYLISGLIFVFLMKYPLLHPRETARMSANATRRQAEDAEMHPRKFLIIAIALVAGFMGVAMIYYAVTGLVK